MLLILLMEIALHILWIGLQEQFFYGIRKRRWCFLTQLHSTACFASQTCVLNCNVIYAVPKRNQNTQTRCGGVLFVP